MALNKNQTLQVVVRNGEGVVLEGEASVVSSINEVGPFDVLAWHANFISVIKEELVLTMKGGRKERLEVQSGVIRVVNNKVEVFLGV